MPRPHNLVDAATIPAENLRPLVGADGPDYASAMFAIGTWGSSTGFRESVLAAADFPLPGDIPAFLVVNQLIYRGAASPSDLADAIDTSRSNLSKVMARLEQANLAMRVADPRDDRAVVLILTDAGREIGRRIVAATAQLNSPDPSRWSADDAAQLERLVVKLARALDALPQHPLSSASGVDLTGQA